MKTVFVVLGESGEYSNRSVWVSGVFASREEAKRFIMKRVAIRREHMQWQSCLEKELKKIHGPVGPYTEADRKRARETIAPEPEDEWAEAVSLFECEIGRWRAHWPALVDVTKQMAR